MIRVIGILLSLFELLGAVLLAYYARHNLAWLVALCFVAALSAFGFVLRMRERSIAVEIADAEDKLVKRTVRRVAKMPLCVAAESTVLIETVRKEVAAQLDVIRDANAKEVDGHVQHIARTVINDALAKHAPKNCGCPTLQLHGADCKPHPGYPGCSCALCTALKSA